MKRLTFVSLLLLLLSGALWSSQLPSVTLVWNPSEGPDILGYNIYYRYHINEDYSVDRVYEILISDLDDPLSPQVTLYNMPYATLHYFVATAFNANAESEYSNEAIWQSPNEDKPEPPANGGGSSCFINTLTN